VLLAAVNDPSLDVARAALERLARLGDPRLAEALRQRLFSVDIGLAPDCARVLRALGDRESTAVASGRLADPLPSIRKTAAIILGELADSAARRVLQAALADPNASVRASVIGALGRLPAEDATLAAVARTLDDADMTVRASAVDAIARLAAAPGRFLSAASADPSAAVRRHLARVASRLDQPLVTALAGDGDADVRAELASALAVAPRRELVPLLAHLLRDRSTEVRRNACSALIAAGDVTACPDLVPALADPDRVVRERALRGLRELLGDAVLDTLSDAAPTAGPRLKRMLVYALQTCDPKRGPLRVTSLRDDPDPEVRVAVAHTLRTAVDATEVTCVLERLAEDVDANVRDAAAGSLAARSAGRDRRARGEGGDGR
jgi:HEAT repeat protein